MSNKGTQIIILTKYSINRHRTCKRCGKEFKSIGERVVSVRNDTKASHYHINHYTDAHGEPIFE